MKSIIAFYTKAKAHLQLSDFYDACAQVRIAGQTSTAAGDDAGWGKKGNTVDFFDVMIELAKKVGDQTKTGLHLNVKYGPK